MTNLTIIVKEETTTVMEIDLTKPINARELAKILGKEETTIEAIRRKDRETALRRQKFEEYLMTEVNLALIQKGMFSDKFCRYNEFDLERDDVVFTCQLVANRFKKLGYYVDEYEYSQNNWYDYYRFSVKL